MSEPPSGHPIELDPAAPSACEELPAFLAPPEGAPCYHGFPLVPETGTGGWCYGAITECINPEAYPDGCDSGDGFVQAPDGSRAGLVWWTGEPGEGDEITEVLPPGPRRWGVWQVRFPRPVQSLDDLVFNFRHVLPLLQAKYREIHGEYRATDA